MVFSRHIAYIEAMDDTNVFSKRKFRLTIRTQIIGQFLFAIVYLDVENAIYAFIDGWKLSKLCMLKSTN